MQNVSAEMMIQLNEVPDISFEERLARFDKAARSMADQMSKHAYSQITEAVERVGNVIEGNGKPLEPELFLDMLEKIHLDFHATGEPILPTLVVAPGMQEQIECLFTEIAENPQYSARYKKILTQKRIEWRDREAARKLVG